VSGSSCPACGAAAAEPFLSLQGVPVNPSQRSPTRAQATGIAVRDVLLTLCDRCALVWNPEFDPDALDYDAEYENSLHFSPVFRHYADELAERLVERHGIRGKTVVELGSGKGEFLALVCERGDNRGVGYDPTYGGESDVAANGRVRFVPELFDEQTAVEADLVVFRHVLEHVPDPLGFLQGVRRALGGREAVVYCEVPAAEYLLWERAVWDVIYPHCSVFAAAALSYLFERAGLRVLDSGFSFGGQYLWVEAIPDPGARAVLPVAEAAALRPLVDSFAADVHAQRQRWGGTLTATNGDGVALWGGGAKGTTFLNLVDGAEHVGAVVDLNPRKQGTFVPGTGHPIVAPEALVGRAPGRVIVMNPLYRDEIAARLAELELRPALDVI
jgi:SAM-dependent methyltransferase